MGSIAFDFGSRAATSSPSWANSPTMTTSFYDDAEDICYYFLNDSNQQQSTLSQSFRPANDVTVSSNNQPVSSSGQHHHGINSVSRFGQITPPDSQLPLTANPVHNVKREHDDRGDMDVEDVEPDASSLSSQRKLLIGSKRLRKGSQGHDKDGDVTEPEDGAKREKFLERNRVAASKCRQKKKVWTNGREELLRELQAENTHRKRLTAYFKEEVLQLKSEMLNHHGCGCHGIRNYLANQASKLACQNNNNGASQDGGRSTTFSSPTDSSMFNSPMLFQGSSSSDLAQSMQASTARRAPSQDSSERGGDSVHPNISKRADVDTNSAFGEMSDKDLQLLSGDDDVRGACHAGSEPINVLCHRVTVDGRW